MSALLWEPYDGPDARGPRLHVRDGNGFRGVTHHEWNATALRVAGNLRRRGVGARTYVGCLLTNTFDVCAAVPGTWLAGGVVVSLPTLSRGLDPHAYGAQILRLCRLSGIELLLVEAQFLPVLTELMGPDTGVRVEAFESLTDGDPIEEADPPRADDVIFVQFSSGSTTDPKGCALTARAIGRHMTMLAGALDIDARDQGVSWLPLSHDMGLFGTLLMSWTSGMRLALSTPQRFLSAPKTWLKDMSEFGATMTVGPNFALALLARSARSSASLKPFPMRAWVVGGERVEWDTLERASAALAHLGVGMRAFNPAYGLAEATLAVTTVRPDEEPTVLEVPHDALGVFGSDGAAPLRLASAGRPLAGVELEIAAPAGQVGEITVRSPSLADGYHHDPEQTARRFVDGGLRTGDLGLVDASGALHVVGRVDDMIAVAGRKIHARDLENALDGDVGVRPGTCVLVDVRSGEGTRLIVLAEPAKGVTDYPGIARRISEVARKRLGVRLDECVIVAGGTIPKTPSGKVQRYRCRQLIEAGKLPALSELRG